MNKLANVWVFSSEAARLPEVMAAGLQLGDSVSVFVLGGADEVARAAALGASKVYHLGEKDSNRIVEEYALTMAKAIEAEAQASLVLLPASRRGKALAAKLGVRLSAGVFNDAAELTIDGEGHVGAKHLVYGGLAIGEEKITSQIAVVTLAAGAFKELPAEEAGRSAETITLEFVAPANGIRCLARRPKEKSNIDLGKAKRVIGVGNGIGSQDNLKLIEQLAAKVGAELGCSRPIAETEKWMERERYIGVSGVMIKPDVYMPIGISGQIQHMVGVNDSLTIIAVNKDKNAPIFQYADYGIVGDINKIVPALLNSFKG
ncbi:FAD-binding protein [Shewanella algae]|uniref:FAD-binding protein n=1 Tax=Shewanella algae TaxID=38313 RepID=UPI001AADC1A5|nr:FAD-binding protein [Shewanella algae]MBO2660060.1 FAD-binding protein [Shewanella algae]